MQLSVCTLPRIHCHGFLLVEYHRYRPRLSGQSLCNLLVTSAALHISHLMLSIYIVSLCKCCPSGCHKPLKGDQVDRTVVLVLSNISRHPRVCSGYREYLDGIGNRHVQHEVQVQSRPCARYLDSSARAANQMPSNQCHQSKVSDPRDTWAREKCEERSVINNITHGRTGTRCSFRLRERKWPPSAHLTSAPKLKVRGQI
jgi:hypothetical protein